MYLVLLFWTHLRKRLTLPKLACTFFFHITFYWADPLASFTYAGALGLFVLVHIGDFIGLKKLRSSNETYILVLFGASLKSFIYCGSELFHIPLGYVHLQTLEKRL